MQPDPLVLRCQAGEREAYTELVRRYQQRLYSFVFRLLRHREEAEDATQEVFMRVFRSLPSYRPESSFTSWLYRIASNYCMDILRKRRQKVVSLFYKNIEEEEERLLEIPDASGDPESLFGDAELKRTLQNAIDGLPPKYRLVILLRHREGLSYQEIADITGLPEGTIKAQIFRARRLLREALSLDAISQ